MNMFTFYQSLVQYLCKDWIQNVAVGNVESFTQVMNHYYSSLLCNIFFDTHIHNSSLLFNINDTINTQAPFLSILYNGTTNCNVFFRINFNRYFESLFMCFLAGSEWFVMDDPIVGVFDGR